LNVVYVAVGYRSVLMKEDAVIRNVDAMSRIVNTYVLTWRRLDFGDEIKCREEK